VRPVVELDEVLASLGGRARSIATGRKAAGLEVELRSPGEPPTAASVGAPVEPGTDVVLPDPARLLDLAEGGASVEVRLLDRQCPEWAPLADDLVTVTGADVFMKLFVSGGGESVNGWHTDGSDVLVTVPWGAKGFAVQRPERSGEVVVDATLRPGDGLRLPRSWAHCATSADEVSMLVSIGLMRAGDWPYRQIPPTHLGFAGYPRSVDAYRAALRSHTPPTSALRQRGDDEWFRTRAPGGIQVVDEDGGGARLVAGGQLYRASEQVVRVLATIHGERADGEDIDLARADGPRVDELVSHGLVRVVPTERWVPSLAALGRDSGVRGRRRPG
jgi:hypothetical protein